MQQTVTAYPLTLENVPFCTHSIVGWYELPGETGGADRIACIHFASGFVDDIEQWKKDRMHTSYVLLDTFTEDFGEHRQAVLQYRSRAILRESTTLCYRDGDRLILNTQYYGGFGFSREVIAKLIEVRDTSLVETGDAPEPVGKVFNDAGTYTFGDYSVRMASPFIMECRSQNSVETVWKLRLRSYLYTEIEERNGLLYFGTAGNGGRLYCVSLADGSVVFSYNSGGTVGFVWYGGNILLADRKDKPVLVDALTGNEMRRIEFGTFKIGYDRCMMVRGDRLYASASGKDAIYAVCVELKPV